VTVRHRPQSPAGEALGVQPLRPRTQLVGGEQRSHVVQVLRVALDDLQLGQHELDEVERRMFNPGKRVVRQGHRMAHGEVPEEDIDDMLGGQVAVHQAGLPLDGVEALHRAQSVRLQNWVERSSLPVGHHKVEVMEGSGVREEIVSVIGNVQPAADTAEHLQQDVVAPRGGHQSQGQLDQRGAVRGKLWSTNGAGLGSCRHLYS
jgi:hypothetical protein